MAWDEWEQLKASAAEQSAARMRLNGLPPEDTGGGVGQGDLQVSQADLAAIGDHAFTLYNRLWNEARIAVPTSDKAAGDLSRQGFALGGALQHVSNRWDKQLNSLMDACAHISNRMDFSRKTHRDDDDWIQRNMSSIDTLDKGFDESYAPAGQQNPVYGEKTAKGKGDN
ncbi:hypothetical protein [Streptomyces jumonjinensis]|uniref:WXG100 family type VII secretion target n=1 Tax=Streptomyces jumonjinensis TaxID=1945 RepID=A0A646K9I6_STRJU|nr:hypothetical protein [Streptomyces jumonjinensis]MQS98852.1 hypothetical protein [Streptomyces jumonjinensis]